MIAQFVAVSSILTGFAEIDLHGTGLVAELFADISETIGEDELAQFLSASIAAVGRAGAGSAPPHDAIARDILESARFGPVARSVITMWYLGTWCPLPADWPGIVAQPARNVSRVISERAYVESLVWRAIDSHPPAAKSPGFGSWALRPGRVGGLA